jgi:hypothetical protein
MIPSPPVQLRARCHTSIYFVICIPELMLRDFGGRSISLSVRPRPVRQLAPEPQPEARSAHLPSQYLYSSSALSGPAPVPPALQHASSAWPGRAILPRQRLTAHRLPGPQRPGSLAEVRCRLCPLPHPKQSRRAGRSFASYQRPVFWLAHEPPEAP